MIEQKRSLDAEAVRLCYRLILGREPESDQAIESHLGHYSTMSDCMIGLMQSHEFKQRLTDPDLLAAVSPIIFPGRQIESQVSEELLKRLLARVSQQWTKLGEADPHWSVLSTPEFRKEHLNEQRISELRASGRREADLLSEAETRTGHTVSEGVCVELGCGVGRITRHLAKRFAKVIALDISPGNLRLCSEYMAEEGVTNVETRLMSAFDDFEAVPEFDVLFSVIVLQHNPPPVQRFILETLLARARPGGSAFFQVPTFLPGYSFNAQHFLAAPDREIDMHALPYNVILEVLGRNRFKLLEARPDPFIGQLGSHTFFAARSGPN